MVGVESYRAAIFRGSLAKLHHSCSHFLAGIVGFVLSVRVISSLSFYLFTLSAATAAHSSTTASMSPPTPTKVVTCCQRRGYVSHREERDGKRSTWRTNAALSSLFARMARAASKRAGLPGASKCTAARCSSCYQQVAMRRERAP
jgi:hypothetical protein